MTQCYTDDRKFNRINIEYLSQYMLYTFHAKSILQSGAKMSTLIRNSYYYLTHETSVSIKLMG